jgi:acyl-CoA synthetase (NDP forming)
MRAGVEPLLAELLDAARRQDREVLLEPECFRVVEALGLAVPRHLQVRDSHDAESVDLASFDGDRVVVKVVSSRILHKSDVGGVAVVANERSAIVRSIRDMEQRFAVTQVAGYTINQFVEYDASLGGELLLGMRWTEDFGPVVSFGPGGIYTEFLAQQLRAGRGTAVLSPRQTTAGSIESIVASKAVVPLITGGVRGQPARVELSRLVKLLDAFMRFAERHVPRDVVEFEINPLVLGSEGPVALDALIKIGPGHEPQTPSRPLDKLEHLLHPRSVAVIGVSEKLNPGRIIVANLIREGFGRDNIHIVKAGQAEIDGCRCYADVASLPERMDLIILSIDAAQVPASVEQIIDQRKAEALIIIPGGLGERKGSETLVHELEGALRRSRESDWRGPLINGGNCLGVRSVPGRYDTLFIPTHKLPLPRGEAAPLAVISQSGAFSVSKASKLGRINPKYLISLGNQVDLTVGDYLSYLKDDPELELFACYVEGFRPGDGGRWLDAAAEITGRGGTVILYRAGRTAEGADASASHTASVAGDYVVARELARAAGVIVAETLADFEDLVRLFALLRGKQVGGWRLGALSNAGFECVAVADNLGRFRLPRFGEATTGKIGKLLERCRLSRIVGTRNPLDVNPTMGDEPFGEAARFVLEDENIDVGIIGCVPLTGALNTLEVSERHGEDLSKSRSVASRLAVLHEESPKAWVAVVDAGELYDPMARELERRGIPTFRTGDRAMRLFEIFCGARLGT